MKNIKVYKTISIAIRTYRLPPRKSFEAILHVQWMKKF